MPPRDWTNTLMEGLRQFFDRSGVPVRLTAVELSRLCKCRPQHAYRMLDGYLRARGGKKKSGLVDEGWVRVVDKREYPRRYELTDRGRRLLADAAALEGMRPLPVLARQISLSQQSELDPWDPFPGMPTAFRERLSKARFLERMGEYRRALAEFEGLLESPEARRRPDVRLWILIREAWIFYIDRETDRAWSFSLEVKHKLRGQKRNWLHCEQAILEGCLCTALDKPAQAWRSLQKAEVIANELKNPMLLRIIFHNKGEWYWDRKRLNDALAKFNAALELAVKSGDERGRSFELWNLGRLQMARATELPGLSDVEVEQTLRHARLISNEGAAIAERVENYLYASMAHVISGEVEEAMHQRGIDQRETSRRAISSYRHALELAMKVRNRKEVADCAGHLALAHLRAGDVKSAEHAIKRLREVAALPTLRITRKWWVEGRIRLDSK